jgi:hypothetical protein
MTTGTRLFEVVIEPSVSVVEGWRNLNGPESYRLSVADKPEWFMTPQTAARLGRGARTISARLQRARTHSEAVKPCTVFTGRSQDGELMIEIGIIDANAIYVSFGDATRFRLTGDQAEVLLQAFALFEDVSISVGPVRHHPLAIPGAQMFESWDWWR